MKTFPGIAFTLLCALLALAGGCAKNSRSAAAPHKHEHHPPHGGTPVVLGDEVYHLELVLDAATGKLQAFVLDGEMENFIRSTELTVEIDATVNGQAKKVVLSAVANPATGESVGDTSLFEGQEDWLKTAKDFDAVLKTITIRGTIFTDVKFNYPKGNDTD